MYYVVSIYIYWWPDLYWLVSKISIHIHTPPRLYWWVYTSHTQQQLLKLNLYIYVCVYIYIYLSPSLYWLVSSFSSHIHTPPSLYWLVYSFRFKVQHYWICIDMLTMLFFGVCWSSTRFSTEVNVFPPSTGCCLHWGGGASWRSTPEIGALTVPKEG